MEKTLKAAILGAGGRGCGYGKLMQQRGTEFKITAACDINPEQLGRCGKILGLEQAELFSDEEEFWSEKRADVLVIATYDRSHVHQCVRAMKMRYDVLLEKPVSDSREELAELLRVQEETGRKVVVCHELRYGPAFEKLYELLKSGVIGRLIAIDAMERVVYWHQAQAYVRIQSVTNDICHPTILAKCSHDLDLIQNYAGAECDTVTSEGELSFFRKENAPEGSAERCTDCAYAKTCIYSAEKIYIDGWKKEGRPEFVWPYNKVSTQMPVTEAGLRKGIKTNHFGKCVFCCGVEENEHVVDHQMVQMRFKNGVIASLKMLFAWKPGRRINLFGTHGELLLDERNETIEIMPYGEEKQVIGFKTLIEGGHGHGGGDSRLIGALYDVLTGNSDAKTSLKESVECHLIGISAEESRLNGGTAVKVHR